MTQFNLSIFALFLVLPGLAGCAMAQSFTLPALGYSYDALEPSIDAQTMEIHFSKHHQGYVNNLNKAVAATTLEGKSLEDILMNVSTQPAAVRNNAGGHYNHTLFWQVLAPKAALAPTGALLEAINNEFGGLEDLKAQISKAAATQFGSGWAWLSVDANKKLFVTGTPNQDNPLMDLSEKRGIPILGIDVWEHAYYLKYQNKRGDYLSAIWEVIDWSAVSANYEKALKSKMLRDL